MIDNKLIIDFMNVGFGECIVIRHGSTTILMDGGDNLASKYEHVPCRTKLIDYLNHESIETIDLLVMTHPHRDHIGGFVDVVKEKKIVEAWYSVDCFMKPLSDQLVTDDNMYQAFAMDQFIKNTLEKQGTKILKLDTLYRRTLGEIGMTVFAPIRECVQDVEAIIESLDDGRGPQENYDRLQVVDKKLNACSLVIKMTYHNTDILFTADALASYWEEIPESETIKAHLLKMPHHGDNRHLPEGFLDRVNPDHVVICSDHIIGGISDDRVADCAAAIKSHIHVAYTELPQNSYHAMRFYIGDNGVMEKMPYRMV